MIKQYIIHFVFSPRTRFGVAVGDSIGGPIMESCNELDAIRVQTGKGDSQFMLTFPYRGLFDPGKEWVGLRNDIGFIGIHPVEWMGTYSIGPYIGEGNLTRSTLGQ